MTRLTLARTLRDLYDPAEKGTAFAIDGFVPEEVLAYWLGRGVLGQTSNQTLFLQRLQEGALDEDILRLHREGLTPAEIFNRLYDREVAKSAEALARWVSDDHLGVSRETDALRAHNPEAVAAEAVQIQRLSPHIFVKIANVGATPEQVRATIAGAMVRAYREGIFLNPNITLVFGIQHYLNTVTGFLDGLEAIAQMGGDPSPVNSVNSLFVSRLDTATDELIDRQMQREPQKGALLAMLKGKAGIAHAKLVYRLFRAIFFAEPMESTPCWKIVNPAGDAFASGSPNCGFNDCSLPAPATRNPAFIASCCMSCPCSVLTLQTPSLSRRWKRWSDFCRSEVSPAARRCWNLSLGCCKQATPSLSGKMPSSILTVCQLNRPVRS